MLARMSPDAMTTADREAPAEPPAAAEAPPEGRAPGTPHAGDAAVAPPGMPRAPVVAADLEGTCTAGATWRGVGRWLAANDLNFSERYLAAVKLVTPGELQRVARKYLTTENRTLVALLPEGTSPKQAAFTEEHRDHDIQKFVLHHSCQIIKCHLFLCHTILF